MIVKSALFLGLLVCQATAASVTISALSPQGVKFSLKDEPGISMVSFHYTVNTPLPDLASGHAVDVRTKTGDEWTYEDGSVSLKPGDTVNYWYNYVQDGSGYTVTDQHWTVPAQTTAPPTPQPTTTASTTTSHGHAHAHSSIVHVVGGHTGTPQQPTTTDAFTAVPDTTPKDATLSGVDTQTGTDGQQVSQTGSGTGSCGCSGTSIRPPGSELGCTSYPCMIFDDEFDTLNLDVWEHEITASGGGNWEFQYYTNNRSNSYVKDGKLFIKPTFTIDSIGEGPDSLTKGALDVWGSQPGDLCTGNTFWGCRRDGTPDHIINPIQSARLRSSRGFNFRYGKVELRAKMPQGDWLWPAIWMLPLRNAYGKWPASGEIDIVEARGNRNYQDDQGHEQGDVNAGSTLHFGSDFFHNKYPTAHAERLSKSGTYGDSFHTYTLIWDEDHISISIDGDEVLNVTPQTSMWEYGGLDKDNVQNPWEGASKMAPFDQEFFLILNVAVGGIAFFPDTWHNSPAGKPWNDKSDFAPRDFWNARGAWYPTWHPDTNNGEDAAMQVDYIRVWKLKP